MYEVRLVRSAENDFTELSLEHVKRVATAIRGFALEPRPHGCLKLHGKRGEWRVDRKSVV